MAGSLEASEIKLIHSDVTTAHLPTSKCKINQALLPSSHSGLLSVCPVNAELLSVIPRVSLPLGWLVSDRLHTHHTCKRTCMRTHLPELMKIQPHPGLSNGPNNGESLGASRVSGRLQDAHGLDGQVLGSDTPTLTHGNTQHSSSSRAPFKGCNCLSDH